MEAHSALLLTKRIFKRNIYLEKIVADDDSSINAVVRHSYKEKENDKINFPHFQWPLTQDGKKKTDNGLLSLHIPEPQ